jgi:hypothetical protein
MVAVGIDFSFVGRYIRMFVGAGCNGGQSSPLGGVQFDQPAHQSQQRPQLVPRRQPPDFEF